MDSYRILSLIDYIQLLHQGRLDKSLYSYFEQELMGCTPYEVNIAIENLLIRYRDVEVAEKTIARFIRAASIGLDQYPAPEYSHDTLFAILVEENGVIKSLLTDLKESFLQKLPELKQNIEVEKVAFLRNIRKLEPIKSHYMKLQYGLFSALESVGAPTQCIKLMWHLEDSVWSYHRECLDLLTDEKWDFRRFNQVYGRMYFLLGTLLYREEKILYPVAYDVLPGFLSAALVKETESYELLK